MYYALIGDMVASRKLSAKARQDAQKRFELALEKVNAEFSEHIAAKFLITLGDECQGLMLPSGDPVAAALMIMHEMQPFGIRMAIGCGQIVTPIKHEAAIGMDGPAFHLARAAVEAMKPKHALRLAAALDDERIEETINTVAALCDRISSDWTKKQEELVYAMLQAKLRGVRMTQTELASAFGIGQSTVNAQLSSAGYNEYSSGMAFIKKLLSEYERSVE